MDPVKIFLLASVVVIFAILLWFAFVFPRLWLWTYFRVTGERPPRRELISRLWKIDPWEMERLAADQEERVRDEIMERLWMDKITVVVYGLVVLWSIGGLSLVAWLIF